MPTVLFCLPSQKETMIIQAFLGSDFSQGGHFCLIQVGLLLWDMILSLWSCDHFSLCMPFPVLLLPSLDLLLVNCSQYELPVSLHTHGFLLSAFGRVLKGALSLPIPTSINELLNRILVHPEQNGCWTLTKCSPGAVKPWKPDLAVWSVSQALSFHSWLFIYLFPLPLRICGDSRSFLSADYHWHCRRSSPGRRHWKGMALY